MFNNITWQGYWITLAFLLVGYYLVVYLLYFRNDFKIGFAKGSGRKWTATDENGTMQPSPCSEGQTTETSIRDALTEIDHQVQACTDELSAYFLEAGRSKGSKEEMLFALSKILSKYPALRSSEYADSLQNLICSEAEHHCSLHLSREDISKVWLG